MRGKHCLVWGWTPDGDLAQGCPHCGHVERTWESLFDGDNERVQESQKNHKENCPGAPSCAFKRESDW